MFSTCFHNQKKKKKKKKAKQMKLKKKYKIKKTKAVCARYAFLSFFSFARQESRM